MSKGFIIVISVIVLGLVWLLFYPAVHHESPSPREPVYTGAIKTALMAYYNEYGSFPSGSNAQMERALTGDNKRKMFFLDWIHGRTNTAGELCDFWGTPYRVRIDGAIPSVTSAGPDKTMDTTDDVTSE